MNTRTWDEKGRGKKSENEEREREMKKERERSGGLLHTLIDLIGIGRKKLGAK